MLENKIEGYPLRVREPATVDTCLGKSIGDYIVDVLSTNSLTLEDRDVLVVVSKLVSIFEGRTIKLSEIKPSLEARAIGKAFSKDPRKVELILREGRIRAVVPVNQLIEIPAMRARLPAYTDNPEGLADYYEDYGAMLMATTNGVLLDDGGIDLTNVPEGYAALLPTEANASAKEIRRSVYEATGKEIAVIVTDTATTLGKIGGQDFALGCAGLDPVSRNWMAANDIFDTPGIGGSVELIADPLAAMGGLLVGQGNEATPMCLIRGYSYRPEKEEGGMKVVYYPRGLWLRIAFSTMLATIFYYLLHILTLPLGSRKEASKRQRQPLDEKKAD